MKVVFRVDSSSDIGSGHLVRCLTLAIALRARGASCRFICRDHAGNHIDRIRKEGFAFNLLSGVAGFADADDGIRLSHSHWIGTSWKTDAQQTIEALGDDVVDWLVVDHYGLDKRWESELRSHSKKIMVIDDVADREHDCDLLLDQNAVDDFESRYDKLVSSDCVCLLGPKYALLQQDYGELRLRAPPRTGMVRRVFVYFGGSDNDNLTALTISALVKVMGGALLIDVVINPKSKNAADVRALSTDHENITVYETLPSLAALMVKADLAVGAAGATTWERCCLGLPSIVVTVAENQRLIAESLAKRKLIRWVGTSKDVTVDKLAQALRDAFTEPDLESWSSSCSQLVDGLGTSRVAATLALNSNTRLRARLAALSDEEVLINFAKEAIRKKGDNDKSPLTSVDLRKELYSRLKAVDECKIYIVESELGCAVGQVRFEKASTDWRILCSIDSRARGYGLEKLALIKALSLMRDVTSGPLLFKEIVFENERSGQRFPVFLQEDERETIAFCSDRDSWINSSIASLIFQLLMDGKRCCWVHNAQELRGGTVCFYLSYGRLVNDQIRGKFRNNLVIHASDLPKGRGWSPASWLILGGETRIPVTLFEAVDAVDAGRIYDQLWISIDRTDLVLDWQAKLAGATEALVLKFLGSYPEILSNARVQLGEPTYFPKRRPENSCLDIQKSIADQFGLFQIADNEKYPIFFEFRGTRFYLKVFRDKF